MLFRRGIMFKSHHGAADGSLTTNKWEEMIQSTPIFSGLTQIRMTLNGKRQKTATTMLNRLGCINQKISTTYMVNLSTCQWKNRFSPSQTPCGSMKWARGPLVKAVSPLQLLNIADDGWAGEHYFCVAPFGVDMGMVAAMVVASHKINGTGAGDMKW